MKKKQKKSLKKNINIGNDNSVSLNDILLNYASSKTLENILPLLKKNLINLN